jgi:NAD-dependent dihydropyrimidine dehydrogenase PreA subunit
LAAISWIKPIWQFRGLKEYSYKTFKILLGFRKGGLGMHTIVIDKDKCTGCKKCYRACFVDVIRWNEVEKKPIAKYPEECATCNWCELSCAFDAIHVIPGNPVRVPDPYPKSIYPDSFVK